MEKEIALTPISSPCFFLVFSLFIFRVYSKICADFHFHSHASHVEMVMVENTSFNTVTGLAGLDDTAHAMVIFGV